MTLVLGVNTFSDPDAGDLLTYQAKLSDGNPLPSWLNYNAATRTFTGSTAGVAAATARIAVTATDRAGLAATDVFDIVIAPPTAKPPARLERRDSGSR
jgi:hypothetical protein